MPLNIHAHKLFKFYVTDTLSSSVKSEKVNLVTVKAFSLYL